jgi:asparagine synthase (glutamine-hydrolysing)
MCGIAGIHSADGASIDRRALALMADSIAHRGPDAEGFYVDEGRPSVGLASRRLAVIDIGGGDQPLSIESGAFTIIYNGEIFNASELRHELEGRGHRFTTHSDTEVVVRGYVEWGTEVLDRLNGMWGFAIWDRPRRRLFIARDRLGVKPLVYAETPDGFVFGSEIKALVASGLVTRRLDPSALPHYLSFFAIPEPYSLIAGVRRLPAGHALLIDGDGVDEFQYWDCALEEGGEAREGHAREIRELLEDAVARRLVSDVPLGVLLSSGIDSGLVTAFAARHSEDAVKTFTLGFDPPRGDERVEAREVASAFGADHTEEVVDARGVSRILPALLNHYDEPGQSLLQNDLVSAMARRRVTVALSGLGGDELFAAYPTHVATNLLARLDRAPGPVRGILLTAARIAPLSRARNLAQLSAMSPEARITERLMHQTGRAQRSELLVPELRASLDLDAPSRHLLEHYRRARSHDPLNRLLYVYLKTYLPDELLRATDSMSMRHSLEIRTPFLDYRLVEASMRIPAKEKMRFSRGKLPLRAIGEEVLPSVKAGKQGFSPPAGEWIRNGLRGQVSELLSEATVRRRGLFDPGAVRRALDEALAGDDRMVPPVMQLFSFEAWAQGWLDRTTPTDEVAA